ncbi:LacI family DNA-binding transcriptional regulator [Asticcacaulis biprosthecium]|uniref:LacI family DNA-binding transcriptional regulator n=1 Tax=Asticcacaulis biprosthecium TaxID=76891 RepID=UPI00058EDE5C|nr:LacI family DNA-binding transcriptional regulator [Asticcacaulis biprosthecium]
MDDLPRRVTLKDVARAADVSLASASYAINGTGSLGDAVRAHVLRTAESLGYRRNLSARAVRTGKTGAIGLVVPDFTNPFFTHLAQSVMRAARLAGYCVFVTDTEESESLEREGFKRMIDRGVDGIVWFPIRDVNTVEAQTRMVPTVLIDRSISGLESIQADYARGGELAAEHLIGLGHSRIGVVAGPRDILSQKLRIGGAVAAIKSAGTLAFCVNNAFSMDLEPSVTKAIAAGKATAVFAGTDLIALGVIRYAQSLGLRVPEDVSVVGFGDMPWGQMASVPLTTIEMPIDDMAQEAVDALMRRIDQREPSHGKVFATGLIRRGSTAAPRMVKIV